jgi:hypothetical protein
MTATDSGVKGPRTGILMLEPRSRGDLAEAVIGALNALGYREGTTSFDVPMGRVARFELAVNQRTAMTIGAQIPPVMRMLADEVIECDRPLLAERVSAGPRQEADFR